ncbi:hypothetical protein [Massilia sp. BKSP1R2A-1]|uniref:hypothetical protein n=1 Tax=Massilia sp. BKSP1R2A-1 TaxID=3422595 RepID=UPI003D33DB32
MTPAFLLRTAIIPAMGELALCGIPDTPNARRFVLAIALQESGLRHRRQIVAGGAENGQASSFWQFEAGGGCRGVLEHYLTASCMRGLCKDFNVVVTPQGLWEAMRYQDVLAAIAARLLIYTLPQKLPTTAEEGWAQYVAAWRPGKPHPSTWANAWATATEAIKESA